jgi:hypothetical protein
MCLKKTESNNFVMGENDEKTKKRVKLKKIEID